MAVSPNTPQEWKEALARIAAPWNIRTLPEPHPDPDPEPDPEPDLPEDERGDDVIDLEVRMMMMMDDDW